MALRTAILSTMLRRLRKSVKIDLDIDFKTGILFATDHNKRQAHASSHSLIRIPQFPIPSNIPEHLPRCIESLMMPRRHYFLWNFE